MDARATSLIHRAIATYDSWRLDELPDRLRRSNLDYYYLSVWPSLSELEVAKVESLPSRPPTTTYAYVHVPFCSGLCSFCSYYVQVAEGNDLHARMERYMGDVLMQVDIESDQTALDLTYIYIGGGTPSLLAPELVSSFLGGLDDRGVLASNRLGTFESHPELFDDEGRAREVLAAYRQFGITRTSIGLEFVDRSLLDGHNRRHGSSFVDRAVDVLRDEGFTLGFDLMYGVPGQTLESWVHSLLTVCAVEPDSIAAYFTFIDHGTALRASVQRGRTTTLDHRFIQTQHLATQLLMADLGYHELPNDFFCKPDTAPAEFRQEVLPSASNMVALGAGAYGYYPNVQFFNEFDIDRYRDKVRNGVSPMWRAHVLSPDESFVRDILFSLKNHPYLDDEAFATVHGHRLAEVFGPLTDYLKDLGLLASRPNGNLQVTPKGRLVVEEMAWLFRPSPSQRVEVATRGERRLVAKHNFAPTYGDPPFELD